MNARTERLEEIRESYYCDGPEVASQYMPELFEMVIASHGATEVGTTPASDEPSRSREV